MTEAESKILNSSKAHQFRITEINKIRERLNSEIGKREVLHEKYKRVYNTLQAINIGSSTVSGLTSVGTIATLSTVVGLPVSLGLAGTSAFMGLISMGTGMYSKVVVKKMNKHEKLMTLALNKRDAINKLLSNAYNDGVISDSEFNEILKQFEAYILLHSTIRHSTRVGLATDREKLILNTIKEGKSDIKDILDKVKIN